jgi:peroxiredoxin
MKKWAFLFIIVLVSILGASAQDSSTTRGINYKTISGFPAFPLLKTDSSKFNSVSVFQRGEPAVIIYFSPTCGHCQHQAEEITGRIKDFKNVQILMVSSYSMEEIQQFVASYGLDHFRNITVAQDPGFNMGTFFELKSLPGIFVYDKKGKLKTHFETNVLANELLDAVTM